MKMTDLIRKQGETAATINAELWVQNNNITKRYDMQLYVMM